MQDFNSRTSCEVRPTCAVDVLASHKFQLTHLLRGATSAPCQRWCTTKFQLTHLLRGATRIRRLTPSAPPDFNSRTSCEVRHQHRHRQHPAHYHFNSRTSCEVRQGCHVGCEQAAVISTHAPLARCDRDFHIVTVDRDISTHAPLARCDDALRNLSPVGLISTHAPLARCDVGCLRGDISRWISTHAPLARCDFAPPNSFRSVPIISTHAPLARCDWVSVLEEARK